MSKNISQRLEPEAHLSQSLPAQAGLTSLPGLAKRSGAGWLAQITLEEIHLPGLAKRSGAGWRKLKYYYERKK